MFIDPYSPIPRDQLDGVLDAAELRPGEYFLDLGSGDGRLLLAAAQRGAISRGIEIDGELVRKSKAHLSQFELGIRIEHGDFMRRSWSKFDVVYHQTEKSAIIEKFHREKNPGARLVLDFGRNLKVVR